MKIFNKIVWDNKEPSNKSDIWYNGLAFKHYNNGNWENMWNINSSETPVIPDITIPTSDWLAKKGEEGYIKNRTHVVLEYCGIVEFSPLSLGAWGDNTPFSFSLPLNGMDCHLVHIDRGGESFDIILEEGSRIPLASGGISDTDNYLLITEAMLSGDFGDYSGVLVVNDGVGLNEEYTITLYTRKYISESVIPDTIARKKDIPTILPNSDSFNVENAESLYYPTLSLYQTKRIVLGNSQEYFIGIPSFSGISLPTNSYVGSIIIYKGQSSETTTIALETPGGGDKTFTLKNRNCIKIDYITNSEGSIYFYVEGNIDLT